MADPEYKNPILEGLLTELNSGRNRRSYILNDICIKCEGDASRFTDEVSRKEFAISGWCQHCQNEMFNDTATEGM